MDDLILAIRDGDIDAFRQSYDIFYEKLYFYIVKCSGSAYLAEEIVQNTFVKIWERRQALSLNHSLSSQVFRTAKSLLLDQLRKQQREKLLQTVVEGRYSHVEDGERRIIAKETLTLVNEQIENLPPIRKKIFQLSRIEGLTYREIAEHLSISPKTVENHILLALKQLKSASFALLLILLIK